MSLQAAAHHLAAQGRGPDTTLVHMAPGEVAGLQALAKAHGGTLTTNPQTGLPEAGILSSILPAVIGAGITAATGGAAAPWMIGLGMGGVEAMRTGSLAKGLQAGLGAYGGAGLGAGLMGAGAEAAANAAVPALQSGADTAAVEQYAQQFQQAKDAAMQGGFADKLGTMGQGIGAAMENPSAFVNNMGGKQAMQYGLAAAAPMLAGQMVPTTVQAPSSGPNPFRYHYDVANTSGQAPAGSSREYSQLRGTYVPYADGGTVDQMSAQNEAMAMMANGGQGFADGGGISHLGDYSDGGHLLRGPGDGVSDSIPATIGGKRPARLADGEFVVPARIVSELGNGSTEAGARKLYSMMDRIQKSRGKTTGTGKVAVDSRADKALPA